MCGGVIFPFKEEYKAVLAHYYSPEQIEEFERSGQVRSLYWQRGGEPVLPVRVGDGQAEAPKEEIMLWGNRDKDAPFPQTGWARKDSIEAGKWAYLKPEPALIPVTHGVEKGKWFEISTGIKGVVVHKGEERRIYMLTEDASPEFVAVTRHERMPVLEDQTDFPWLASDPNGMDSAQQLSLPE
jgi:hypothetical protein